MAEGSERYRELAAGPRAELGRIFESGERPGIAALIGHEYRGFNHFWLASPLRIRKFIKAFFKAPDQGDFGCNTPVEQNGVDGDWIAKPSDAEPKRYAFFAVGGGSGASRGPTHALLLDYGRVRHRFLDPSRFIRDYVVRIDPGSDDLLLGKAHLALGPLRLPIGFFLLERKRPLSSPPTLL